MRFTTEVPAEFQCKVCSDPWDPESAVNCSSCESVFCHRCHLESMAKEAMCLHCGKQPSTFTQPHRLLRSMAANLEVLCDNQPYGCNWTGPRSQFTSHMSVCDKRAKQFHYLPDAKIPAELLCPICHDPMVDPVQLKCEHAFCKHCITLALQVSATCPIDRSVATPADFSQPPKAISSLLDDLSVRCANHAATPPCTWTGKRQEVKAHVCAPTPTEPTSNPLPVPEKPADPTPAPAPTKEMQLEAIPEFPSLEASNLDQEVYVLAHLTAPIMTSVEDRKKPLSLSAVIDVSGSMAGEKLAMAKESLKFMIKELSERDELGIIAFESEVEETLPMTKMDSVGKERALAAAESLKEKGCTNLSGGLFSGVAQVDHQPFGTAGRTGTPPPVTAQVAAQVRPKSGGLSSLFSRMSEAAYGRKAPPPPPRPEAKLRSVFWLTKMKRDGKQLYQYTVDLTVNAQVLSNVLIQPHGQGKLAEKRINPTSASQSSTWESTAPVTHWAFTAVLPPTSVAPGEPNSFNFQHMMADQEQQEASFTIPGRGAEPAPAPAKSKKRDDCGAVMVFTDGAANRGLCDPTKLAEALTDHLSKATPMVVHTFGFGSDHNATLLQKLAEIGAGSYYFIQDVGTMKESFADCLGGLMSTAAQNISLEIQPEPGFKIDKVLTTLQLSTDRGYPVVSMRDVYSGEKRDILVRLKMDRNREVGSTAPVVRFTVKYDSLLSAKQEAVNTVCAVAFAGAKSVAPPNILVDQQRARILVSEAIAKAREIADSGNVVAAQNMMRSAMNNVSSCVSASSPYVQAMRTDLASLEAKMATPSMWVASGSKAAAQVQSCHVQQRQNFSAECEDLGYDNAFKKEMRSKARK